MDEDSRALLEKLVEQTEENTKILHKLHRQMLWERAFRVAYWVIILAVAIGAFYFIQPLVEAMARFFGIDFSDGGRFVEIFRNFR
jgi:hypothetical protein